MIVGIYPGSFDPITYGHLDLIKRAVQWCDRIIVAVPDYTAKNVLFTPLERQILIEQVVDDAGLADLVTVRLFTGLLAEFVRAYRPALILRGIRDTGDLNYELRMFDVNQQLNPDMEYIFVPASSKLRSISSTIVKEVAKLGGDLTNLVPARIIDALRDRGAV